MKRFIVTLILTVVIAGVLTYAMPKDFHCYLEDITSIGTVYIYCRSADVDGVDMGNGKMVSCSLNELQSVLKRCSGVDGVSVTFDGSESDVTRIAKLLSLHVVSTYELDGLVVTCGKSAKVRGGVVIDGNVVNVQIAYRQGVVTVGNPLILGSY